MTQDDLTKLALIKLAQEQQQARVDVITVTLMREGINKHRARELADHFVNFTSCIGKDPRCPCQDGDACHYKDCGGTKAWPVPKAEPVGEVVEVSDNGFQCEFNQRLAVGAKLYTTPPAAQQAEPLEYWNAVEGWVKIDEVREHFEAVNCGTIYKHGGEDRVPLYTAPAQRKWVGLTDEEMSDIVADIDADFGDLLWKVVCLTKIIQAELKEKNK